MCRMYMNVLEVPNQVIGLVSDSYQVLPHPTVMAGSEPGTSSSGWLEK